MKNVLALSILLVLIQSVSMAQATDALPERHFAMGVRSSLFQSSDLTLANIPPSRFIFQYDVVPEFRAELQIGGYNREEEMDGASDKLKDNAITGVLGVHLIKTIEHAKFTTGFRYGWSQVNDEYFNYAGNGGSKSTDKESIQIYSLVFGGEYFLAKWFSVGAEFAPVYMVDDFKTKDESTGDTSPTNTASSLATETNLLFRFYLN